MPSRNNRERRREGGSPVLPILIAVCVLIASFLIVALIRAPKTETGNPIVYPEKPNFHAADDAPLVVRESTKSPEPSARIEATPEPESDAPAVEQDPSENRLMPEAKPFDDFIPVCEKSLRTPDDQKMIAVTIDDCGNLERLQQIVQIAYQYNCKLTLFPYGESIMKSPELARFFNICVNNLGYELENHGYNAREEYKMADGEVIMQIWKQSVAASYAVGRDYTQHFFRPYNRNSNYDQRTHYYAGALGFTAIGGFTHSYQNYADGAALAKTLANGNIYQFDMNKKTLEVFEDFLIEANKKGYSMVTMNRLFGLPENEIGASLTIDQQEFPELPEYNPTYYDLELGYRTGAVIRLQQRLIDMGYIRAENVKLKNAEGIEYQRYVIPEADGIYGSSTSSAVSAFQGKMGIPATGNADVQTQQALFSGELSMYGGE